MGNGQLNLFSSHNIEFKYIKLVKRLVQDKQLYLFSHCFGNSNSCVQIKSCDIIFYPSYPIYHKFGRYLFWIGGKHSCLTPKAQISKEIEVDISIVKHDCDFVPISIFSLRFFVGVFSKTLIVDWAVSSQKVMAHYFNSSKNDHMKFSLQPHPCGIKDKFLAFAILYCHGASKAVQE